MIDSRKFLFIFTRFQIILLIMMAGIALYNDWTVYDVVDLSRTLVFAIVLGFLYILTNRDTSYYESSEAAVYQKYISYLGFGFIFFILLDLYVELTSDMVSVLLICFLVLLGSFLYTRLCKSTWVGLIIKALLICFLCYLMPMNMINKKLDFYKINMMQFYENAKIISAIAGQYEVRAPKRPIEYVISFNKDFKLSNCSYILRRNYYCQVKDFENILGKNVIVKISNDDNKYLLAINDANNKELYNFYDHYKKRQRVEYIWAWFYKIEYYIFLLFLVLLPLPKQSYTDKA